MSKRTISAAAVALCVSMAAPLPAARGAGPAAPGRDPEMSGISGDVDAPRRHFRLRYPADLGPRKAEEIYGIVREAMAGGYARSGLDTARSYQRWRRHNTAPYLSRTHGNHYLNNYSNEAARAYARFEDAGELPVGAIIAKDSFSVTESGGILLGPLFLMEKMPEGFNYVSGDWKYTLVQPDGTIFGETRGPGAERVRYCITCHLMAEDRDHLYFVPEAYRP